MTAVLVDLRLGTAEVSGLVHRRYVVSPCS